MFISVVKDACSLSGAGPSCCTTDIVNSYGYSLGDDLKLLFDEKLGKLRSTIHEAKANVDRKLKIRPCLQIE